MEERHLSLNQVARLLGKSQRTIRRWIKSGKLKAYKPGRDFLIPESAVRELMEESEVYPKGLEPSLLNALEGPGEPPRSMRELLNAAGVADRELEMPQEEFYALFEGLSYEKTLPLAWRVVNARHAIEPLIVKHLEDAGPKEALLLKRLRARAVDYKIYAILSANAAADREIEEAQARGDDARATEAENEKHRFAQVA